MATFKTCQDRNLSLDVGCTVAGSVWNICMKILYRFRDSTIKPSRNPSHPQVSGLRKLDEARRDRYREAPVSLTAEEVQGLAKILDLGPNDSCGGRCMLIVVPGEIKPIRAELALKVSQKPGCFQGHSAGKGAKS